MPQSLSRHPESRCVAAARVEVELLRQGAGTLLLSYVVYGNVGELRLPPITAPARRPDLWQQTCFEAFVGTAAGAAYYEFNFAPSTQWAAYRFSSYRTGMSVATEITPPDIEVHSAPGRYTLQAALNPHELADLPRDVGWRLGLAANWAPVEHPPQPPGGRSKVFPAWHRRSPVRWLVGDATRAPYANPRPRRGKSKTRAGSEFPPARCQPVPQRHSQDG